MSNIWRDFLNTPGYNSDEAARHGGHEAYMKHMKEKGIRPEEKPKITGLKLTGMIMDEMQSDKEASELDMVAIEVADYFEENKFEATLVAPCTLTVKVPSGEFRKVPHIGGENFVPVGAYAGKRNNLIFVFRPVGVTSYATMEMTEADAKKNLAGFDTYLKGALNHNFETTMKELRQERSRKKELEKVADKANEYGEEFASW